MRINKLPIHQSLNPWGNLGFSHALNFGANATDVINCGTNTVLANLTPSTVLTWVYQTNSTGGRFWNKGTGGNRSMFLIDATNVVGARFCGAGNGSDECTSATTNFTFYGLNKWMFVAIRLSHISTTLSRSYVGDQFNLAAEPSGYDFLSIGTADTQDNSAADACIGNNIAGGAGSTPWLGYISFLAIYNRLLEQPEIQLQQRFSDEPIGPGCVGFWNVGFNGIGPQLDLSGYNQTGVVSGPTFIQGPPRINGLLC